MKDQDKTKEQLINELAELRQRVAELEAAEGKRGWAEEALWESEEQFRELVENANDIIYTHDLEGNFTSVNPAATRIYGYTTEEALQLNIAQIVDPEYRPLAQQKIREKLEGSPRTGPYELLTYSKEGEPIWVEVSTRLLKKEGQPVEVQGIARDITGRKRAEEALRESEERLRTVVSNVPVILFTLDREGMFTLSEGKGLDALGFKPGEVVGQSLFDVYCDVPQILENIRRALAGETFTSIVEVGELVFETRYSPLRDQNGEAIGIIGIAADITERKRAEEELRQSYVKLRKTLEGTVKALVSAIELRDPYTAGHQRRVTQLACAIAKEMELPEEQIEGLRMAALIHDIGKINIPAEILSRPGPLNGLGRGLIQAHAQLGHDILNGTIEFPWPVAEIVLQHHERLDGSGYPQGLSGDDILLEARILGVADVVEAMASRRPYRPAHNIDEALEEISQHRGVLYDPEVVDACLKLFTEKGFKFE